jgi:hypothetical protein
MCDVQILSFQVELSTGHSICLQLEDASELRVLEPDVLDVR